MESKAKLLGHPLHPWLIVFPMGLFSTAVIFDTIALLKPDPDFHAVAYWMIISGIVGGLAAAIFGYIDWAAIPSGTRAKSIGTMHGLGNVFVLILFGLSAVWRNDVPSTPEDAALTMSYLGFVLAFGTGWLGGELVDRLGVGVDDGAHLNAPNSLRGPISQGPAPGRFSPLQSTSTRPGEPTGVGTGSDSPSGGDAYETGSRSRRAR